MGTSAGAALLLIGLMLLAGYVAHLTSERWHIPRVTILLLIGVTAGPSVLDLVPAEIHTWFPFVTRIALAMVGFLLGESFVGRDLREHGRQVVIISVGETLSAALVVCVAVLVVWQDLTLALLLGAVAPASAPAAIFETVRESSARGPLTRTLLGVVAIDDAWGVILFSIILVATQAVTGAGADLSALAHGLLDVFGALALGAVVGLLMAWVTHKVREGEATLLEAGGFVLSCAGLAVMLELSYLLATLTVGAVLANRRGPDSPAFHDVEHMSQPLMAIFFVLAGMELELETLADIGWLGGLYVAARALGLVLGGALASAWSGAPHVVSRRIGWCLLPQAGVALGFALLVNQETPSVGSTVLQVVIATTVVFELLGPPIARWQLVRSGEV